MTKYEKQTIDNRDIFYEILSDGFKIYVGQQKRPLFHQYEPYIPDPDKTYEENAKIMCEQLCEPPSNPVEDRLTNIEANIDYLMLLNDTDSIDESEE